MRADQPCVWRSNSHRPILLLRRGMVVIVMMRMLVVVRTLVVVTEVVAVTVIVVVMVCLARLLCQKCWFSCLYC